MRDKIKVLFYCSIMGNGGAEKHLLRLINTLNPDKFEISLALVSPGGTYGKFILPHVKVIHLNGRQSSSFLLSLYFSKNPLAKVITETKPDLVYSVMDPLNVVAYYALKKSTHNARLVCNVQTTIYHSVLWKDRLYKRMLRPLLKTVYPEVAAIISLSEGVKQEFVKLNATLSDKIHVVPNLIEIPEVVTTAPDNSEQLFRIILCGRIVKHKGFQDVIEALPIILKHQPVFLTIVGEGIFKGDLEKQVRKLNLENHVEFLGYRNDVLELMATSDVFVLPSWFEAFGNVIIEAMAAGTPVIATDCPYGPAEIIEDGKSGVLIPVQNPERIANAVIHLIDNKVFRDHLVKNGKQRVTDFYSNVLTSKFEKILLKLTDES